VIEEKLRPSAFPRSASYDPEWALENTMGPNVLWLTEALSEVMELRPGMRVLDLGCGKAISSIFLAKEFGVRVWATDLWIPAAENLRRVRAAGAEEMVFPIHAEAHALPYAEGFFDALVSIDAYHYFGTDDLYLGRHLLPLGRPGARIGVIVPGLVHEFEGEPPAAPGGDVGAGVGVLELPQRRVVARALGEVGARRGRGGRPRSGGLEALGRLGRSVARARLHAGAVPGDSAWLDRDGANRCGPQPRFRADRCSTEGYIGTSPAGLRLDDNDAR